VQQVLRKLSTGNYILTDRPDRSKFILTLCHLILISDHYKINNFMNQLYIDNKPWSYFLYGLGCLSLIASFSILMAHFENLNSLYLILSITFLFTGVTQMTGYFGTQKTFLRYDSGSLTIKWHNRITAYKINFTEIESIYLQRAVVIIRYKTSRILKLNISVFTTEQKREVYGFFINLSRTFNLNLLQQFR
jgi:hypothetical protein